MKQEKFEKHIKLMLEIMPSIDAIVKYLRKDLGCSQLECDKLIYHFLYLIEVCLEAKNFSKLDILAFRTTAELSMNEYHIPESKRDEIIIGSEKDNTAHILFAPLLRDLDLEALINVLNDSRNSESDDDDDDGPNFGPMPTLIY
uniref:Uncharacterized protein n=1 Tax=Eustigmatophyceae sp. Chic 10/23 P-6w TaxID=1446905 RepID=A0A3R5QLJ0_9STRA|nr:hypothetical protein [Eustigmatophyceae sp. Chic 10/23 P-6w]QAA11539.1 hypothetical protein [Eustigmatophyceae sp. Chic 10/23 P-6w]